MEEVVCMFYAIELLNMLEHMHTAGVVHLDLTPANLMLRNGGQVSEDPHIP
jgi:checkpoint serine/threonine-protein kinase